jgi:hypothetical protein
MGWDGQIWRSIESYEAGSAGSNTSSNGTYTLHVGRWAKVRTRMDLYTSGTVTVTWYGDAALGGMSDSRGNPLHNWIPNYDAPGTEVADGSGLATSAFNHAYSESDDTWYRLRGNASGVFEQGNVAHDAADAGNPVKVGGKANAAAPTDVSANNDRVDAWFLRNGAQATVVTAAGALIGGDAANGLDVDVTRLPALPAGTNNIGDVDVLTLPGVGGLAAHASATSGNPVYIAGRASAAIPTDVGADGDAAGMWTNRNGATVVLMAPHVGLNSDPWALVHEGAQYTSAQTSTVLVAGGASEKIVVTKVQIQAFATTAGTAILYFGTGAYSRGTNRALFDGEFAPSATLKPGVVLDGPFISGANGDDLLVTTTNALSITFSVWYYVVT